MRPVVTLFGSDRARAYTRIFAVVSIAGLLAANVSASTERVVCMGDDGHVSVEDAIGGFCSDSPNAASQTPPEARVNDGDSSHCGPCKDLPISTQSNLINPARESFIKTIAPTITAVAVSDLCSNPGASRFIGISWDATWAKTPAVFLRSVSLKL